MRDAMITILMVMVSLGIILVSHPVQADSTYVLTITEGKPVLNLIPYSTFTDDVTYSGSYNPSNTSWTTCSVSYTVTSSSNINVSVTESSCTKNGDVPVITIKARITGTYMGESSFYPFSQVIVKLQDSSGNTIESRVFSVTPIQFNRVNIVSVDFDSSNPIASTGTAYYVTPSQPALDTPITISTSGDVNIIITLSDVPSAPTTLSIKYGSSITNVTVDPNNSGTELRATLNNVSLAQPIYLAIYNNGYQIYTAQLDPSRIVNNVGGVVFIAYSPFIKWLNNNYVVSGSVGVINIVGGSLTVQFTVTSPITNTNTTTITSRDIVEISVSLPSSISAVSGYYKIIYTPPNGGSSIEIDIPFSASKTITGFVGLDYMMLSIFVLVMGSGFVSVLAGILLRRPDLLSSGVLLLGSGVLIFIIPSMIVSGLYLISNAARIQIPNDIQLTGANTFFGLGNAVQGSINYITESARILANNLRQTASLLVGIIAGLFAASAVSGALSIFLGPLATFIGQVSASIASQLIQIVFALFMSSVLLDTIAVVYPVLMSLIVITIYIYTTLQILLSSFTGNPHNVIHGVMSLTSVLLMNIIGAIAIASIENLKITEAKISLGIIDIPNPFLSFTMGLVELVIISGLMAMAFQRLMAALSGS